MNGLERPSPKTFVSASRIRERHASYDLDILGRAFTQHQAAQRPIDNTNPIQISRPEDKIRILRSLQKHRDIIRVVRKVSIQFKDKFIPVLQGPIEACNVSSSQAVLFISM